MAEKKESTSQEQEEKKIENSEEQKNLDQVVEDSQVPETKEEVSEAQETQEGEESDSPEDENEAKEEGKDKKAAKKKKGKKEKKTIFDKLKFGKKDDDPLEGIQEIDFDPAEFEMEAQESKGKTVFVSEGDRPHLHALLLKLKKAGYDSVGTHEGSDVLEMFEKQDKVDLLILDLVLPGTNGYVILDELAKRKKSVPTFVITDLSEESDREQAEKIGVTQYFEKDATTVFEVVNAVNSYFKVS